MTKPESGPFGLRPEARFDTLREALDGCAAHAWDVSLNKIMTAGLSGDELRSRICEGVESALRAREIMRLRAKLLCLESGYRFPEDDGLPADTDFIFGATYR